jgi:hypothetical protein
MADWVPRREGDRLLAFQLLTRALAERPDAYGVSAADAAEAVRLVAALSAAMCEAANPYTRTALHLAAKQDCLAAAQACCRRLAASVRDNPAVARTDLLALGITTLPARPTPRRRRVPPPTSVPLLMITRMIPGGHEIAIADADAPSHRGCRRAGRPKDTKGLELFVAYSADELTGDAIRRTGQPHTLLTRGRSAVIHPDDRLGSVANYIGRWLSTRGEPGPFSLPVSMVLGMPG